MSDQVRVEGLAEVAKRLRALPKELGSKGGGPLRYALFQATKVIRDDAKRRAPVDTGNLRDSIIAYRDRNPKAKTGAAEIYYVGMRGGTRQYTNNARNRRGGRASQRYRTAGKAWYGRFVELGTSKMPAKPFLRPAFETNKQAAVDEFSKEFAKAVTRAERKLARMR